MNLAGDQIKDTYGALLNIGASGALSTLQPVTDGFGNVLPFELSTTTFNFTGNVTGGPIGPTGAAGSSGTSGTSGVSGTSGTSGTSGVSGSSGTSGTSGTDGTSGTSGINGATGPVGPTGAAAPGGGSPITIEQTNSLVSTGVGATASVPDAIVIGATASATTNSIVIGRCASASQGSNTSQLGGIVIGNGACLFGAGTDQSIAIGQNACANGNDSGVGRVGLAIGLNAKVDSGLGGVAIGTGTCVTNTAVAIGWVACAEAENSSAFGLASRIQSGADFSLAAAGYLNCITTNSKCSNAIGSFITISSCIANGIGWGSTVCSGSNLSTVIGNVSTIFPGATGTIVLGNSSVGGTGASDSVVIGNSVSTQTPRSIMIGGINNAITGGLENTILGGCSNTINGGCDSFIKGSGNTSGCVQNIIIGRGNNIQGGINREGGCLGNYVFGINNTISDSYTAGAMVIGQENTNGGYNSLTIGRGNNVGFSVYGITVGQNHSISSEYSMAFGVSHCVTAQGSFTVGKNNSSCGYAIYNGNQFIHGANSYTMMACNTAILGGCCNQIVGIFNDLPAVPTNDVIIGGNFNCIGTYALNSVIIGGTGNIIPAATGPAGAYKNVVILGGTSITANANDTVYTPNLRVTGQAASLTNAIGSTGGSVTLNWDNSNIQTLTLTDNITTLTKSNPIDGAVYTLFLTQGGTGGKTVSWGTDVEWPGGTPPTLSTAAGSVDAVSLVYIAGITGYYGNSNLNFS